MTTATKTSLDASEFDRIYEAEQAALKGNKAPLREAHKEIDAKFGDAPRPEDDTSDATGDAQAATDTTTEGAVAPEGEIAAEGVVDASSDGTTQTEDWLASLDPNIKANVEKLLQEKQAAEQARDQYIKSNEGRIAAEQRKARQLEQQLQQERQRKAVEPPKAPLTAAEQATENEFIKMMKEGDPELGKYLESIEQRNTQLAQRLEQFNQQFEQQRKESEDRHLLSQVDIVRSQVTNVDEIWESKEYNEYINKVAPRAIWEAAQSPTAEGALAAIRAYGEWAHWMNEQAQQTTVGASTPTDPAAQAQAQKTLAERNRKVQAQPVASNTTARPSAVPTDNLLEIISDPKKHAQFVEREYQAELKKMGIKST